MPNNNKRRAVLDDGCCPELVRGAQFDGFLEIPMIERPNALVVPDAIVPFSMRDKAPTNNRIAIGFYEMDPRFSDVLISPESFIDDFARFTAIISPDCSLYRDAPLAVQITNLYRNRAIGNFYQRKGLYVIPQIRWGGRETYTTSLFSEKIAFLGAAKHSIVAIGTYGCIQHHSDKEHFKAGLEAMMDTLEPEIVLVYGSMPDSVFRDYLHATRFVQYSDWTTTQHGGDN